MINTEKNEKSARASELFDEGYNCSQAVTGAWCGEMNIPFETAVRISSGFGGGMGRMGEVCGAVSGALMVIGTVLSTGRPGTESKNEVYKAVRKFSERFKEETQSETLICREMVRMKTDNSSETDTERTARRAKCRRYMEIASALLEEFITPEKLSETINKTITAEIVTFGNFAVYCSGSAVRFRRSKSREALAFLVDRKTPCTKKQIAAVLFEDRMYDRSMQKYTDNILRGMIEDLNNAGAGNLVIHTSNSYCINTDVCRCDYYEYLKGSRRARISDEYMSQYSWAEDTLGLLREI